MPSMNVFCNWTIIVVTIHCTCTADACYSLLFTLTKLLVVKSPKPRWIFIKSWHILQVEVKPKQNTYNLANKVLLAKQ